MFPFELFVILVVFRVLMFFVAFFVTVTIAGYKTQSQQRAPGTPAATGT